MPRAAMRLKYKVHKIPTAALENKKYLVGCLVERTKYGSGQKKCRYVSARGEGLIDTCCLNPIEVGRYSQVVTATD